MPDEYKKEFSILLLSHKPANEHQNVRVLGVDTGMMYFGPDNETNVYTPRELSMPQYDIYARRHDLDVEYALKIRDEKRRKEALWRADEIFMKNMDKIAWKYPKQWVASRIFRTGIQFLHYRKFFDGSKYVSGHIDFDPVKHQKYIRGL